MNPPAGRVTLGARVMVPGDRVGKVVAERSVAPNGAWVYTVRFADGSTREHYDFELRVQAAA